MKETDKRTAVTFVGLLAAVLLTELLIWLGAL